MKNINAIRELLEEKIRNLSLEISPILAEELIEWKKGKPENLEASVHLSSRRGPLEHKKDMTDRLLSNLNLVFGDSFPISDSQNRLKILEKNRYEPRLNWNNYDVLTCWATNVLCNGLTYKTTKDEFENAIFASLRESTKQIKTKSIIPSYWGSIPDVAHIEAFSMFQDCVLDIIAEHRATPYQTTLPQKDKTLAKDLTEAQWEKYKEELLNPDKK